jgi:hypothetical protein
MICRKIVLGRPSIFKQADVLFAGIRQQNNKLLALDEQGNIMAFRNL